MSECAGYLSEREMTKEMVAWMTEYRRLIRSKEWHALVEHVRLNVNLSKEVLLSIDPEVQRKCHSGSADK